MYGNEYSFQDAASKGNIVMMKYLVKFTPDEHQKDQMIHSQNDVPFREASSKGHIEVMKYLVELTPEEQKLDQMIHSQNDEAFKVASSNCQIEVMKYLVELTRNEGKKLKMVHYDNDFAFRNASLKGNMEVLKYLVEITPNQKLKEEMIHALNDNALRWASSDGRIEVMKYLFEITSKFPTGKQQVQEMIHNVFPYYKEYPIVSIQQLLIKMDNKQFQQCFRQIDQNTIVIPLPEVINQRGKMKVIDLCVQMDMDVKWIDNLSKETYQNLLKDLKIWSLLSTLRLVVKGELVGFQNALYPTLPDEIFLHILSYIANQVLSKPLKNSLSLRINNLITYYMQDPDRVELTT
jgi:hypothetical protein